MKLEIMIGPNHMPLVVQPTLNGVHLIGLTLNNGGTMKDPVLSLSEAEALASELQISIELVRSKLGRGEDVRNDKQVGAESGD